MVRVLIDLIALTSAAVDGDSMQIMNHLGTHGNINPRAPAQHVLRSNLVHLAMFM